MDLIEITEALIAQLASAEDIVGFFAKLRYNTNVRVKQTPSNLNIASDDVIRQINRVELIADQDGLLQVYLFELKTVTVAITQAIARALRNLPPNILMVLTNSDYERIDFVLLEKILPKETKRGPGGKQLGVIPRVLSIRRRSPERKEMKILRRLSYTEEDGWAQYEKMISAFSAIGWTTDYYTNRGLFSNYVLNNRLRNMPEWHDNPTTTFREMTKTCFNAGNYFSQKSDWLFFHDKYISPILEHLGYHFKQKDTAPGSDGEFPDYFLYLLEDKKKPSCGLSAFPWNRLLDATDTERDKSRGHWIPGQYVVRLMEKHDLSWFIITNGKIWRLYSKKTHSKATEFYEIDLEEILAMEDPQEAFRFFWLLFRADAFKPKPYAIGGEPKEVCLLDRLFLESETYAKELGEKLKDNIFKNVFPKFAKGFIAKMGGTGKYLTMSEDKREEELNEVFRGTLTFLYRMLFLFYAESRDLLPVREVRGYWEVSLQQIKEEIKDKAGPIRENVESNLKRGYGASDTTIYDRLSELFTVIDKGSPRLNVPTYNGGLFFTDPTTEDGSLDAANARFLKNNKIPDRFLAEGLDFMARELDDKTTSLEFIDYKSLGVRQLGSIYEGLLEFKVRIAQEDLAVVKGKKTEEYVPLVDAKKPKEVIKKGEVYLENDKHERKASGSYYTPDYIVKYIVENTVGPVLSEKMDKLKPKLRSHDADPTLVDELFEVRVLDPAMGSGHFLVETVDFITDKMVDYLSRFPNNPVQIEINRMREEILREMDDKKISVDPARLNDLNLLRRLVLKRCIYGVDLNPMAVELAKVSLWLHCFTLGAPLSFLDHHLKCGNSLIGAKVDEVAKEIEGGQMTLFSTYRFGDVDKATDMMLKIGELYDVTPEQVNKSKESYKKALSAIEPYKLMLDIYTSRWFGNEPYNIGKGKMAKHIDLALAFLKSDESEKWLKDPDNLKALRTEYAKVVAVAMVAAKNSGWQFFHWELEFPEVWYTKGKRKDNPGFDAVVGNPPYVRQEEIITIKSYLECNSSVYGGRVDIYAYFFERGISILKRNCNLGYISSRKFMNVLYGELLRQYILENAPPISIIDFGDLPVFDDVTTYPAIYILSKKSDHVQLTYTKISSITFNKISNQIVIDPENQLTILNLNNKEWSFNLSTIDILKERISKYSSSLHELVGPSLVGIKTGLNSVFIVSDSTIETYQIEKDVVKPFIMGRDFDKYSHIEPQLKLIFPYTKIRDEYHIIDINNKPNLKAYFGQFRNELEKRAIIRDQIPTGKMKWYDLQQVNFNLNFNKPKIIYRDLSEHGSFTIDDKQCMVDMTAFIIQSENKFLLSILNSILQKWLVGLMCARARGDWYRYKSQYVERLPIRHIHFTTSASDRINLVNKLKNHYARDEDNEILKIVKDILPKDDNGNFLAFQDGPGWIYNLEKKEGEGKCPEKSDVVHDFLAFLAEQMIDLNRQKQAEQKRFFGWIEIQLSIIPKDDKIGVDALSGKKTIQGYLGDYQKGEEQVPFDNIADVLYKNKARIGANLSDPRLINILKIEYEKSLTILMPIKEKLRKTDWLIDQVVYKLYGLTEDDIAIVEGRAVE